MTTNTTSLDLHSVVGEACRETGLEDMGLEEIREPLAAWLHALQAAPFTEAGLAGMRQMTQRYLVNRLRFRRDITLHPEILDEDVSDPIIVVGFPRSGTTVLQRMLSADPAVQSLLFWKVLNPAPFPEEADGKPPAARIAFAQDVQAAIQGTNPALFAAHPSVALDAEEDWFLHHFSFQHVLNPTSGPFTRSYTDYLRTLPRQPTYEYAGNMLRYLQWQNGGRKGRPWVLKSPAHIGYLEEILQVHPRATFVYPRRDFRTVMASFCYTLELSLKGVLNIDPLELGALSFDVWLGEMTRFHATRERLGKKLKLIELPYDAMLKDPIHHIGEIHRQAGRQLDAEGERAIQAWIADNPPNKHGKNTYSLDRYGLTPEQIDEAFGDF